VQPVFQSPITKELTMVISTPIRDEKSTELGVLAARLNLKRFFQLINDATGLGESGETVVSKKIEHEIKFMAPTRHDADAALARTVSPNSDHARSLQEASLGNSGAGTQDDYRGVHVYAAWQHVPSLEWGLLVKIDQREALSPLREARNRILLATVFVVVLALAASLLVARTLVEPLRKLKAATDRISRGDLDVQLDIRSGDEIGELADSFERMIAAIKYFRERRMEPDEDTEGESSEPTLKS
jgi:nitrogen fixation/metabolism regulation signal transduction histidine kinase